VKERALASAPEPIRLAPALEPVGVVETDGLAAWEEESESADGNHVEAEPESGGGDAGSDGIEPFDVEEAA
jgi:hypothetical protein